VAESPTCRPALEAPNLWGRPKTHARHLLTTCQAARKRYEEAAGGRPERLVSGSDDFTMFLWTPSNSKAHVARMTGHVQLINQVGPGAAWG
jgi:hypothetical protein